MRSNKQNAGRFCPLLDLDMPVGDVWVAVKKAKIPFHIEEMGTGPDGLAKLKAANREVENTPGTYRDRAIQAFSSGAGNLTEVLKASDVVTDPHYSAQDARRDAELFPDTRLPSIPKRLWVAFKAACKDVWDGSQPKD